MENRTLIERIARDIDRPREDVQKLIDALADVVGTQGADMDSISIPSFGTFEPKKRAERVAVHPSTGVRLLVPPKIVLTFRPSALLKQKVREA